jgi:hypothetical protein
MSVSKFSVELQLSGGDCIPNIPTHWVLDVTTSLDNFEQDYSTGDYVLIDSVVVWVLD